MPSIEDKFMTASQIKEVTDTKLDKDFSNSDINPSVLTNLGSTSADDILKASPRPGVTGVLPLVNGGVGSSTAAGARTNLDVYSKSETNTAIQQSTALLKGEIIPLLSNSIAINPGKVQYTNDHEAAFSKYEYVDLYFAVQGGNLNAVRICPGYTDERKYKLGFFAWNDDDGKLRRVALTFTTSGRYMTNVVVKGSYDDNGAFVDSSNFLFLYRAIGYKW